MVCWRAGKWNDGARLSESIQTLVGVDGKLGRVKNKVRGECNGSGKILEGSPLSSFENNVEKGDRSKEELFAV